MSDRPALPGRRVLVLTLLVTAMLTTLSTVVAWHAYRDDQARARGQLEQGAYERLVDVTQFLSGRQQLLDAVARSLTSLPSAADRGRLVASLDPSSMGLTGGVALLDRSGQVLAATPEPLERRREAGSGPAGAVLGAREPMVSDGYDSQLFGGPVVVVAAPVGELGVLVGAMPRPWLDEVARRAGRRGVGDVWVIDRSGGLVAASDGTAVLADDRVLARVAAADQRSAQLRAGSADGLVDPSGRSGRALGYATDPTMFGWSVVVGRPESAVYAAAWRDVTVSWLLIALVAGAAIVGAVLLARRLDRRAHRQDLAHQGLQLEHELTVRLQSVSTALVGATTAHDIGDVVIGPAVRALGARSGALFEVDADGQLRLVAVTPGSLGPSLLGPDSPVAAALASREVIVVDSEQELRTRFPRYAAAIGPVASAGVVVPLECFGRVLGVAVFGLEPRRPVDSSLRYVVRVLAGELASSLERADVLAREASLRREVEAQHDRLESTLEATDTGWWRWDVGTRTITWSAGVREDLGLGPEMTLEELFAIVHRDDKRRVAEATARAGSEGLGYELEFRVRAGGEDRWLWTRALAVCDEVGRPIAVDGIVRDITERHRHDEALRRSEQRLRTVLDGLFVLVGMLDPRGVLVEVNRAALDAAGAEPGDLLGHALWDLPMWSGDDASRLRESVRRAVAGDTVRLDVTPVLRGREVAVDVQMVPLRDERGEATGVVISGLDMTDRVEVERQRRATLERLAFVAAVGEMMDSALSLDARLEQLAALLVPRFGEWGIIGLADGDEGARSVAVAGPPDSGTLVEQLRHWSLLDPGQADVDDLRRRRRVVVLDADQAALERLAIDEWKRQLLRRIGPRQVVWVPLFARGRSLGAVMLLRTETPIEAADVGVLDDLARRVGLAIDNAALYARQERIALELQRSLLPRTLPQVANVRMAARYRPAVSDLAVGGDWYDVIRLPRGATAFVVGDVVGRGLGAAAVMGQLRSATRALARQGASPAEVLGRLDDFAQSVPGAACTTVAFLRLEADGRRATLALAGHPPPLLLDESGGARFVLDGRSPPLGLAREPRADASFSLDPGAQIVLYTDGLIERRGEVLDDGMERMRAWTERLPPARHPMTWIDELLAGMDAERPFGDDVCVVAVQTAPSGAVALQLEVSGRGGDLATSRRAMRRWLDEAGVGGEAVDDVVLAVGEAVANAVEHAFDGSSGTVLVAGLADPTAVEVVVSDRGRWRRPAAPGNRGRGIAIMRRLMDTVDISSDAAGSVVTMVKVVAPEAAEVLR